MFDSFCYIWKYSYRKSIIEKLKVKTYGKKEEQD